MSSESEAGPDLFSRAEKCARHWPDMSSTTRRTGTLQRFGDATSTVVLGHVMIGEAAELLLDALLFQEVGHAGPGTRARRGGGAAERHEIPTNLSHGYFLSLRYCNLQTAIIHTTVASDVRVSMIPYSNNVAHALVSSSTAARTACSMSHTRSAPSSTPTESRIKSSPIPRMARSVGGILP